MIKRAMKSLVWSTGLDACPDFLPGFSVFGVRIMRAMGRESLGQAQKALNYALSLKPKSVLDVGSGGGRHAAAFHDNGASVVCIDLGTSIYFQKREVRPGIEVINTNFESYRSDRKFDLVWCSHVLEHQRNVGAFLERLILNCAPGGHVCISVPYPHRGLWGGHVSYWTPAVLAYQIALCGMQLRDSKLIHGFREFAICFSPTTAALPELSSDSGDLDKLKPLLPPGFGENCSNWISW